jgi:hypothetical protein
MNPLVDMVCTNAWAPGIEYAAQSILTFGRRVTHKTKQIVVWTQLLNISWLTCFVVHTILFTPLRQARRSPLNTRPQTSTASGRLSVLQRVLLITFHTLRGKTTNVGGVPEGLTIVTLSDGSWFMKFFPSDYAVAQITKLEYFTHVGSCLERYYRYRVLVYYCSWEFVHFGELYYFHCLNVVSG